MRFLWINYGSFNSYALNCILQSKWGWADVSSELMCLTVAVWRLEKMEKSDLWYGLIDYGLFTKKKWLWAALVFAIMIHRKPTIYCPSHPIRQRVVKIFTPFETPAPKARYYAVSPETLFNFHHFICQKNTIFDCIAFILMINDYLNLIVWLFSLVMLSLFLPSDLAWFNFVVDILNSQINTNSNN